MLLCLETYKIFFKINNAQTEQLVRFFSGFLSDPCQKQGFVVSSNYSLKINALECGFLPSEALAKDGRLTLDVKRAGLNAFKNIYVFGAYKPARESIMLDKKKKERLIDKFKTHDTDTGSPQVQIAILSEEIKELTSHLQDHKKDFSSRRGLIRKVSERRRLLKYLHREDPQAYDALTEALKL